MRLLLAALCSTGLVLAACDGDGVRITSTTSDTGSNGVLKVVEALQCPETLGVLTRKGTAHAGGTTCLYSGPRGAEVSLQLVALTEQDAATVLQRFENALSADMPHTTADLRAQAQADAAQASADAAQVQADIAAAEADRAGAAADAAADRASVRLPGMSIDADGDKASVRIGGFSINADDSAGTARIASSDESVSVNANDDAAEIRTNAPGEATRRTYLLTDSRPADQGWRLVGFEARGPVGGPLVIATVRAKDRDSDGVFDSAKDLVTLNVGE